MLSMQALAHRNTVKRKRKTTVREIKVVQRKDRTQITCSEVLGRGVGHLGLKICAGQSKTPKKGLLTRNPAETTKTS
jgi:hypothetical protein